MIFITAHSRRVRRALKRGLTLVEIMIAMAIFSAAVAVISGSGIFMTQWSVSVGNYLEMNQQGRMALEILGRDLRMSSNVRTATTNRIVIDVADRPNQIRTVEYFWNAQTGDFVRIEGGVSSVLVRSVTDLEFVYFDAIGSVTTRSVDVKAVEISAQIERMARRASNTNFLMSARFTLRNKVIGT